MHAKLPGMIGGAPLEKEVIGMPTAMKRYLGKKYSRHSPRTVHLAITNGTQYACWFLVEW